MKKNALTMLNFAPNILQHREHIAMLTQNKTRRTKVVTHNMAQATPIQRARMSNTAICPSYVQIRKSLENGQTTSLQAFISPLNACAVAPAGITRLPYCAQQPT
jgi:hypothetical protein